MSETKIEEHSWSHQRFPNKMVQGTCTCGFFTQNRTKRIVIQELKAHVKNAAKIAASPHPEIEVRFNNAGVRTRCGFCGITLKPTVGEWPFIKGTSDLLCETCEVCIEENLRVLKITPRLHDNYDFSRLPSLPFACLYSEQEDNLFLCSAEVAVAIKEMVAVYSDEMALDFDRAANGHDFEDALKMGERALLQELPYADEDELVAFLLPSRTSRKSAMTFG